LWPITLETTIIRILERYQNALNYRLGAPELDKAQICGPKRGIVSALMSIRVQCEWTVATGNESGQFSSMDIRKAYDTFIRSNMLEAMTNTYIESDQLKSIGITARQYAQATSYVVRTAEASSKNVKTKEA